MHNMRSVYGPVHVLQVMPGNTLHKRQTTVSPTSIPTYASPCSSIAAFSSACSCLGVPRTTITAAAAITTSIWTITETHTPSLPTRVVNITDSQTNTTTARPTASSNSTGIYSNTSVPTTSSPTRILDTTCGETAAPFSLQVSQPGGLLDGWYAFLSGDGVLFTSARSSATSFSVEGSGHLCAVGYEGEFGYPVIAVVTNLSDSGAVWLLDGRRAAAFSEDYVPVECQTGGGGGLACAAGATRNWVGCGLQLDLSSEAGGSVVVDGLNCSAISLEVV
ncbi:hypothetical protein CONLIGDRAFT_640064 [Coniochaeta ligniaria NRRL 30616]|uniref:Uncharacterized protein n=1 Tax=Coniochaeta ligniaria NRRL 30616 TaxID=1408157 RepID=A0A1J7IYR6_9PEZI|nr:hypothetical protein CONLIGDRAFT_640064 [Coniochaeta ligniaria NRRL 30616]